MLTRSTTKDFIYRQKSIDTLYNSRLQGVFVDYLGQIPAKIRQLPLKQRISRFKLHLPAVVLPY